MGFSGDLQKGGSKKGGVVDWERRLDVVAAGAFARGTVLRFEERELYFAILRACGRFGKSQPRAKRKWLTVHTQAALRQVVDPVRGGDGAGSALNGLSERDLAI